MLTNFLFFISRYYNNTYPMIIITKLADNEPSGCSVVVSAKIISSL